jgi:hypothetical protein
MPPTKYGKYVTREIITESKYPQISTPIARYNGCRGGDALQDCEWSCITKSFTMDNEPELDSERDQFLLFASADIEDPKSFDAEIELSIGGKGKKQLITEPTYVYIPKGTKHGFVSFKKIKKPIAFVSYYLSPEFSTEWVAPDESKYLGKLNKPSMVPPPDKGNRPSHSVEAGSSSAPFRYIARTPPRGANYMLWSSEFGWPAKVSPAYSSVFYRDWFFQEPVHAHRESHQISMFIGSDPLNIEDFDAVIDVWMGKERERHIIDTCAVDHYVPGIVHLGDEVRIVNKPFIRIMWVIGPYMQNYFKAAVRDKVLLSDESKGETMISEGSPDYVPPTKIEDWVWPYPKKK